MELNGYAKAPLGRLERAFAEGFAAGRDVGAAVAVCHGGEVLADLWAGHRDRRRAEAWQRDTLACCFSISKAVSATCVLQAIDAGLLRLEDPVAEHWPEFAAAGKAEITVREVLAHRAGLIGFHEPVSKDIYYRWDAVCAALAAERPWWEPGTAHGYHARTYGFLLGELLRRAGNCTVGEWLRAHISDPLALDLHIGLTSSEHARCAEMIPARIRAGDQQRWPAGMRAMMADFADPQTPTGAAFQNPSLGAGYMNSAEFRSAELPALNGHATARAIASFFAQIPKLVSADLLDEATSTQSRGLDIVLKSVTRFGLGYMLHDDESPIGRPGCFGHAGAGGSVAFYDPKRDLAFAFLMNQMQEGVATGGASANACVAAVYESLS